MIQKIKNKHFPIGNYIHLMIIFQKALYIELKNKLFGVVCKGQLYYKKSDAELRRLEFSGGSAVKNPPSK